MWPPKSLGISKVIKTKRAYFLITFDFCAQLLTFQNHKDEGAMDVPLPCRKSILIIPEFTSWGVWDRLLQNTI